MIDTSDLPLTSTHWGTYRVESSEGRVVALHDFEQDDDPSPIGRGIVDVLDGPTRIKTPMFRKGWLQGGPGGAGLRGNDTYVELSWEEAEVRVASELDRVRKAYGNEAIYAGSYGWASAGRFHHAQSQLRRFLNCIGGCSYSVNTYSFAAAEVLVPHVLGGYREFVYPGTVWTSVIENTELFVAFGGVPLKNGQIAQGGCGRHRQKTAIRQAAAVGVKFVNISPIREDIADEVGAEWLAPRPNTDVALLLALAHTLLDEGLYDQTFLDRYTVGFDKFAAYVRGDTDGKAKSADWAAEICELPAESIQNLARRMVASRTMLSVSWSLTRQDHGEQPFWAVIALAAMIGQIGLPGGGFGLGYSAVNSVGNEFTVVPAAALPQGENPVRKFIPVARITDMLLNAGGTFDYDGGVYTYPDVELIYWAGGNPFHHHQDLYGLREAWQRPDTIIANEWCWNALARHADIVLPCTTPLEREDIAITPRDGFIVYMEQAIPPVGHARDDYDIFRGIAAKMGCEERFTEGRTSVEWSEHLYARTLQAAAEKEIELPTFKQLREQRWFEIAPPEVPQVILSDFRRDPEAYPLKTLSGRIEIFSETIAAFAYEDCPGNPTWMEPYEWLGVADEDEVHLISNQPKDKLHSQLDHGSVSRSNKIDGREPVYVNPDDAADRDISAGDIVRVFNERGACFCGAVLDDGMRRGVVCISTGAWFEPADENTCLGGNPNVLTRDKGTSRLAHGPTAHTCLVRIERCDKMPKLP